MARENPSWGYCRLQGELKDLGHRVASTTIANVLKQNGIQPAPDRPSSWQAFIKAHWGQIAATDFFTVEVWSPKGLVTHYVLFVIDLKARCVEIAGITTSPNASFMAQVARKLTDGMGGFLSGSRMLVCDRDTKFTPKFKAILHDAGVQVVLTPKQAPNCNAYVERFVLSIKSECLDKMVFFGRRSLENALRSYVEHYHGERAHQGLGNEKLEPVSWRGTGPVECWERLGGILKSYRRAA